MPLYLTTLILPILGLLVVAFIIFRIWRSVQGLKVTPSIVDGRKTLNLQTPIGTVDIKVEESHDPVLAGMPKYPGAQPVDPAAPEAVAEIDIAGRKGRYITQNVWTADPVDVVLDNLHNNFPDWQPDAHYDSGYRIQKTTAEGSCAITVSSNSGRTEILYEVVYSTAPIVSVQRNY